MIATRAVPIAIKCLMLAVALRLQLFTANLGLVWCGARGAVRGVR